MKWKKAPKKKQSGWDKTQFQFTCQSCGDMISGDMMGYTTPEKTKFFTRPVGKNRITVCYKCKEKIDGPKKFPEDDEYNEALRAHYGV